MNDQNNQSQSEASPDSFIMEQREWLKEHKASNGLSWNVLAARTGIPTGTLSQFGGKNGYAGDESRLAEKIDRYRANLLSQRQIRALVKKAPGYFSTQTSEELINLMTLARLGKIVVAAMGAGTGKTMAAEHFRDCYENVWLATFDPSSAGPNTMCVEVLRALGVRDATGSPQKLSRMVIDRVTDTRGLLLLDECQHLKTSSFDLARSWYDRTGIGIAFFGNYSMMERIEGEKRSTEFAQIYSRLGLQKALNLPLKSDAETLSDAWGIDNIDMRNFIVDVSQKPGGLRGVTNMLELASMFAEGDGRPIDVSYLKEAWSQVAPRQVL
jgi:DNA transposition AAA+ family ATPase